MEHPAGDADDGSLRVDFDRRLKLEFHGSRLHALAYNLANFLRTLALPEAVSHWSMTTLRNRLVKIGAKIVRHGRSISFQIAEVMVSRGLFQQILGAITALRPLPPARY